MDFDESLVVKNPSSMGLLIPPGTPVALLSRISTFSPTTPSPATSTALPTNKPTHFADRIYSSLKFLLQTMTGSTNDTCISNCSGRGECLEGTCFCQVQYHGDSCTDPNIAYFVSFASIFYLIAFVSFVQLLVCVRAEYARMKTPSLRQACAVTTQKMLYVITCLAAVLRGAYFSSPSNADLPLSASFMSAYYPIILTAGSLIVCFWAEAFHLRDIRCDRPRFLSKSFMGFFVFNFITYSLFLTEIILTKTTQTEEERDLLGHIFNGCYAILMFIVVVFFLIYGVEVYFKVRGGFVSDTVIVGSVYGRTPPNFGGAQESPLLNPQADSGECSTSCTMSGECSTSCTMSGECSNSCTKSNRTPTDTKENNVESSEQLLKDNDMLKGAFVGLIPRIGIDHSQLHQSRFGLVFQASMLMITVCFLCSDVLGGFWKNKVPLMSRNAYDIIFRVVELAVALWFPCVLWNCISPEQLWILNPKKILKKWDFEKTMELGNSLNPRESNNIVSDVGGECWICYDSEAQNSGPMIHPCDCKGDVGAVHHNCLRKWLMECAPNNSSENLACKVCGTAYQLERKNIWWIGKGFTAKQWLQTATLVTVLCGTIAGFWAVVQLCDDAYKQALAAGASLIVFYICLRLLGFNFLKGYQRAKMSAVKILGGKFSSQNSSSAPIVATVMPIDGHDEDSLKTVSPSSLRFNLPESNI